MITSRSKDNIIDPNNMNMITSKKIKKREKEKNILIETPLLKKVSQLSYRKKNAKLFHKYIKELSLYSKKGRAEAYECGTYFTVKTDENLQNTQLVAGNFCKKRLCPVCEYLKARKHAYQLLDMIEEVRKTGKVLLFLTLTAPNVKGEDLKKEITDFNKSFVRMFQREQIRKIAKGYIKKLEITYNEEDKTYHPHLHVLIAVNKSYFKSKDYLNHDEFLKLWRKSKRDELIQNVNIQKARIMTFKDVFELSTYASKSSDVYSSKRVFKTFYESLEGRRIITFGGLFKTLRKKQREKGFKELLKEKTGDINFKYYFSFLWTGSRYELKDIKNFAKYDSGEDGEDSEKVIFDYHNEKNIEIKRIELLKVKNTIIF